MAAPDRHEPPLAKVHRMAPVAPFKRVHVALRVERAAEHDAVGRRHRAGGGARRRGLPPNVGTVCHSSSPVTASMPLHTPFVVVVPFGSVHATALLLALAV